MDFNFSTHFYYNPICSQNACAHAPPSKSIITVFDCNFLLWLLLFEWVLLLQFKQHFNRVELNPPAKSEDLSVSVPETQVGVIFMTSFDFISLFFAIDFYCITFLRFYVLSFFWGERYSLLHFFSSNFVIN